jgi:class 3 adenylate cyclase
LIAFGGRLVKTTGDGVLLEFPSIVAAVECAVLGEDDRGAQTPRFRKASASSTGSASSRHVLIEGDDGGRVLERAVEHADGGADGLRVTMP